MQSATESVVSVIEAGQAPKSFTDAGLPKEEELDGLAQVVDDEETQEFQRRVREATRGGGRRPPGASSDRYRDEQLLEAEGSAVAATSRYEELISTAPRLSRERSLTGSQTDVRHMQEGGVGEAPAGGLGRGARSIESPPVFNNLPTAVRHGRESPLMVGFSTRKAVTPTPSSGSRGAIAAEKVEDSSSSWLNASSPSQHTTTTTTTSDIHRATSSSFKPKPIEISIDPTERPAPLPDPMALTATTEPAFKLRMPANFPYWFVITYTYSIVMILILLLANMIPDGRLYINFTAFWSIIIYILLDDDQAGTDPIESVVEGIVKKNQ